MSSSHIDELDLLIRSKGSTSEPNLKAALSRLSLELKERRAKDYGTSLDFFSSALKLLSRIKGSAHIESRMSCLVECAMYLYINDHCAPALDAARQLRGLAAQSGNKGWLRKSANLSGIIYADFGNVAEAIPHYAKALQLSNELGKEAQASVLSNLGVAMNYSGLYREAIPCLQASAAIARSSTESQHMEASALANLAQSYLALDECELGLEAIRQCLDRSLEPANSDAALAMTIREFTYIQLALELGKLSVAREHAIRCASYARSAGASRAMTMARIAGALCEVHGGNVPHGLAMLEAEASANHEVASTRIDVLTALIRAHEQAAQPERALFFMSELLEYTRRERAKSIAALSATPFANLHDEREHHDLRALKARESDLRAQVAEREVLNSRIEMLERLAVTADLKEEASGEHGYRVGRLAALLAEDLNWTREAAYAVDLAARLHDIGKIAVPDRILLSSQELKDAERHFMSTHTIIGAELLAKSNIAQLRMAEEIARCHHEWWNGEGYPARLVGKRIPIHARIVALADVFDALTHGRPFAQPWPLDRAIEEIRSRRGTQFDPELTDAFLALIERLRIEHQDLDEYLGRAGRSSPFLQARNRIRLMIAEERDHEEKATFAGNETRH